MNSGESHGYPRMVKTPQETRFPHGGSHLLPIAVSSSQLSQVARYTEEKDGGEGETHAMVL